MKKSILLFTALLIITACQNKKEADKTVYVKLETTHGDITLMLFNETPLHRDNFVALVNSGFYNDILFHRIIEGFMIQTGNPQTRGNYIEGADLSKYRYTIPAEIVPGLFHRKGAVAAARTGDASNPLRASSSTQFYIVQGVTHDSVQIIRQEERINENIRMNMYYRYMAEERALADSAGLQLSPAEIQEKAATKMNDYFEGKDQYIIPDEQKEAYATEGGAPHLDMNYTVFGQVIEGFEVIDKIAAEERDRADRPLSDSVRILKAEIIKK
jgi:peptidyl-prolyl cis-trans isomerase B (cyclophilin B)